MNVYLIRHTSIDIKPGICYGQSDVDVAESFAEDAEKVRQKLSEISLEAPVFYSSPLQRCHKLAKVLASHTIHVEPRIQELNFGDWELKQWDQIPERILEKWSRDIRVPCPGGESYLELNNRVVEWWKELRETGHQAVVVVTHSGVIQSVLAHVLGMAFRNSSRLVIDWGHLSAVSVNRGNYIVRYINR